MKNKATLLLHSFAELIECLSDEEAGKLLKAIFDYDIRGEETTFEDRSLLFLYKQITNSLDTHKAHYEKVCKARRKNAEVRWGTEQKSTAKGENMQMHANAYNININKNTNENENTNSNENISVNEIESEAAEEIRDEPAGDTDTNKKAYGDFSNVFLTDEEYEAVRKKLPDGEERLQSLSAYMAATGKTYVNHYARLKSWQIYDNDPAADKQSPRAQKSKKPPGERREPTFDIEAFKRKALNPVYEMPEEENCHGHSHA